MVAYADETVFPAARDSVWRLLQAHLDDAAISSIHPLIHSQKTTRQSGGETVLDRAIDVRGKTKRSTWKVTYRPPEFARWEILESEGPWATGSFIENTYSDAPGGTLIRSRGDLKISVLPFFLPQGRTIRHVLDLVHTEDVAYLQR